MKKIVAFLLIYFVPVTAFADLCKYEEIVSDIRNSCGDILTDLKKLKNQATVNVEVTGVGTLSAGGALYAGISKASIDKQVAELEKQLDIIENMSDEEFLIFLKAVGDYEEQLDNYNSICAVKKDLEKKSKSLGNVRTGLMAANTATAIAGTVIANKNKNKSKTIATEINDCLLTINMHRESIGMARLDCSQQEYQKLRQIEKVCGVFSSKHLDKITNKSAVAMVSSAVNVGTGAIGTATSAMANSDSVRNDDSDKGVNREKNLNTAANVFSGASTVASGVATIFNAMTIKAINDNITVAESCMEALE